MKKSVVHTGTVIAVKPGIAVVRIEPSAQECTQCAIAALCSQSETIEVRCPDASDQMIGQKVEVSISVNKRNALLAFFIIPAVLGVAAAASSLWLGATQTAACLYGLGVVALWFLLLYAIGRFSDDKTTLA